ncbi:MAG TPA: hypothetical protein DF774_03965 [Rheinheimera sp.]|nr:hypothetical protein [Rheinheimera sp.]
MQISAFLSFITSFIRETKRNFAMRYDQLDKLSLTMQYRCINGQMDNKDKLIIMQKPITTNEFIYLKSIR